MPKPQYLFQRKGVWYLRVRVPMDLVVFLDKKEIHKSLQTKDLSEAKLRATPIKAEIEQGFITARNQLKVQAGGVDDLSGLSAAEQQKIVARWTYDTRSRQNERRLKYSSYEDGMTIAERVQERRFEEHRARAEALGDPITDQHEGRTIAAQVLSRLGIGFDHTSEQFAILGQRFSDAIHHMAVEDLRQIEGKLPIGGQEGTIGPLASIAAGKSGPSFQAVADEFLNDPARELSASTVKNYTIILRAVDEVFGLDQPIAMLTRQHCKDILTLLRNVPSNALKKTKTEGLAEAAAIAKEKGLPVLAAGTVNMHLQKLSAILEFAVIEDYVAKNPAKLLGVKDKTPANKKRHPFDADQLKAIFGSPLYTGCINDGIHYNKVGLNRPKGTRFWVPLISLWTGMRLSEVCQLHTADVAELDGVPVILITPDDNPEDVEDGEKRVKTDNGIRFVPVHPMLIRCGFLNFVDRCVKDGQKRLFPDLKPGPKGDFGASFSKWFGRYLVNVGAKKPRTAFHSFRHNYRDALREAEIPAEGAMALGGWAGKGTDAAYGKGLKATTLAKYIERIEYPDLDLSHLWGD